MTISTATKRALKASSKASSKHSKPASDAALSKREIAKALLQRPEGASIEELMEATSWQAHSARAILSGIRKDGAGLVRQKIEGHSRYFLDAGIAQ